MASFTLTVQSEAAFRRRVNIQDGTATQDWLNAWEAQLEVEGGQTLIADALTHAQNGDVPFPTAVLTPDTAAALVQAAQVKLSAKTIA